MDYLSVALGIYLTHYLKNTKNLGPIKGSALATIIFWPVTFLSGLSLPIFFGGSFIGMTDQKVISPKLLFIPGLLFITIFEYISAQYSSLGGALGMSAFLSVVITFSAVKAFPQNRGPRT
ncbi:MAG: hypothetical protein CME61_07135 [Halobacteriovoraceae bacterium]|nr:hypothetical protein [Halobacteriovoraceae bacterium]|tara:strand:- start:85 stop:444 length:360 start_codon:yes stop_codon:yes gene_type:complete